MLRAIGSVLAGYVVMFVIVFVIFTAAFLAMGTEGAFKPGTFDPSTQWLVMSFVVSILAAVAGGFACALIAKTGTPPKVLAGLVLVLGLLSGILAMTSKSDEPNVRSGDLSNQEAMMQARQPVWVSLLNPIVGAVGVTVGARLRGRKPE